MRAFRVAFKRNKQLHSQDASREMQEPFGAGQPVGVSVTPRRHWHYRFWNGWIISQTIALPV